MSSDEQPDLGSIYDRIARADSIVVKAAPMRPALMTPALRSLIERSARADPAVTRFEWIGGDVARAGDRPVLAVKTLFESRDKRDLDDLRRSLHLRVPARPIHCMCGGAPAIYLYEQSQEIMELTNHHAKSIRCSPWVSDLDVTDTEAWLTWFDRRGIASPRHEVEDARVREAQVMQGWDRWLLGMPSAIRAITSSSPAPSQLGTAQLCAALGREVPDEQERILQLLTWFGSGSGPWSGFPAWECDAEGLLLTYSTESIVNSISGANLSCEQVEGAARLFAGWSFSKQRPGHLSKLPRALKALFWSHVRGTDDLDKRQRARRAFLDQ